MKDLRRHLLSMHGSEGEQWFESLPDRVDQIASQYSLTHLNPFHTLNTHFVAAGYQHGKPIVLKLAFKSESLSHEAASLNAYCGVGVPAVLAHNHQMIIMEHVRPGTMLKDSFYLTDQQSTLVFCEVASRLHGVPIPPGSHFKSVASLLSRLDQPVDLPDEILAKVRLLKAKQLNSSHTDVLLHGDLHHENILRGSTGWTAIDPKGFIGDPCFEVACYLANPMPDLLLEENPLFIIEERIALCHRLLNQPVEKIHDWLILKTVLCWIWSIDDHADPSYWQRFATLLLS